MYTLHSFLLLGVGVYPSRYLARYGSPLKASLLKSSPPTFRRLGRLLKSCAWSSKRLGRRNSTILQIRLPVLVGNFKYHFRGRVGWIWGQ